MTRKLTENEVGSRVRIAIFAGSFDPFTVGHADIVARGLEIFDRIIVAIGVNPVKNTHHQALETVSSLYADNDRVKVMAYEGLTVELVRLTGACALLRGIRSVKDMEYERNLADINMRIGGVETVFLMSRPELAAVSSSVVRELQSYGQDVSQFLPSNNK